MGDDDSDGNDDESGEEDSEDENEEGGDESDELDGDDTADMDSDESYVQGSNDKDSDEEVKEFVSEIDDIGKGKLQGLEMDQMLSSGGLTLSGAFASLCLSTIVCLLSSIFY